MKEKKELVSFNEVVRDIASLVELDDEALDVVVGGHASGIELASATDAAEEPGCNTLC